MVNPAARPLHHRGPSGNTCRMQMSHKMQTLSRSHRVQGFLQPERGGIQARLLSCLPAESLSGPRQAEQPQLGVWRSRVNSQSMRLGPGMGRLYPPGSSEKCIQNEEGIWFTPKEFEIEGKRATSRKWKQSVHCRGKTLEELLKVL